MNIINYNKLNKKKILLLVWILVIIFSLIKIYSLGVPTEDMPEYIAQKILSFGIWTPLVFILIYTIRPLIFFPATLLSLSSGILFGPYKAILILILAENFSAFISYSAGKYVGRDFFEKLDKENKFMRKFDQYLQENDFITVLLLRLLFAPFDLTGYFAGASGIKYFPYAIGTFFGILPGLTAVAFLGGSVSNPYYLGIAAGFIFLGILVSNFIKRRYHKTNDNQGI